MPRHLLTRRELVGIVGRLMSGQVSSKREEFALIQKFEDAVPYPYGGDLIVHHRHEFRSPEELVDFALGLERYPKLSREQLIAVTKRLMDADVSSRIKSQRLTSMFKENIPHPDKTDLIYYPTIEFSTAEELVDYALSYKPPK